MVVQQLENLRQQSAAPDMGLGCSSPLPLEDHTTVPHFTAFLPPMAFFFLNPLSLLPLSLYGKTSAAASHPRATGVLVITVSNSPASIETLLALKNRIHTSSEPRLS